MSLEAGDIGVYLAMLSVEEGRERTFRNNEIGDPKKKRIFR